MIGAGEEELICDFAETYHIYDYKSLPASRVAILASGLREDSRIKMKMNGEKVRLTDILIAMNIDLIAQLAYIIVGSTDEPPSILEQLEGRKPEQKKSGDGIKTFESPEELKEKIKQIRGEA